MEVLTVTLVILVIVALIYVCVVHQSTTGSSCPECHHLLIFYDAVSGRCMAADKDTAACGCPTRWSHHLG